MQSERCTAGIASRISLRAVLMPKDGNYVWGRVNNSSESESLTLMPRLVATLLVVAGLMWKAFRTHQRSGG